MREAPMEIILSGDQQSAHLTRVSATLAVRRKSNNIVKARMCGRGDVVKVGSLSSPMSASTDGRGDLLEIPTSSSFCDSFGSLPAISVRLSYRPIPSLDLLNI